MRLRLTTTTALLLALAAPLAADGQAARVYRIGALCYGVGPAGYSTGCLYPEESPVDRVIVEGLRARGYVVGKNLMIDAPKGSLQNRVTEVVRNKPDLIFVHVCDTPLRAARAATDTIPIVVGACNDDLVAAGFVASLARPAGNITGVSKVTPELAAKRLELLRAIVPTASRVAVLWTPSYSDFLADWRHIRAAAQALGVTLQPVELRAGAFDSDAVDELVAAFATMVRGHADALITFSDVTTWAHAQRVADLALKHRLPMISPFREMADVGGLIAYGPNLLDLFGRVPSYVDRIFKGARPGDLPIEQPTKFDFVINLKTAKALGLTIPQSLLLRADEVIQ